MEVLSHLAQLPVLVMSIEERGCPSPYPSKACGYASQRVKVGFYGNYALSMNVGHLQKPICRVPALSSQWAVDPRSTSPALRALCGPV